MILGMDTHERLALGQTFVPLISHGHVQDSHTWQTKTLKLDNYYSLWLVETGSLVIKYRSKQHTINGTDIFISQPGSRVVPASGTRFRYLAFTISQQERSWNIPTQIPLHHSERTARLLRLWSNSWWRTEIELLRCNAQLSLLLLDLLENEHNESADQQPTDWLENLRWVIRRDLPHGPSASTVATAMGVSRSQLYRQLQKHTRQSVKEIIQAIQLEEATRFLLNPEYRVANVGRMVGFASNTVFTRWFRRQTGQSPTEWRREMIPGFSLARVNGRKRRDIADWENRRHYN